jgi:hypothetical protein
MRRPTHIDVDEFERSCRTSMAATNAIADAAIARGDADPSFVAAQREFTEARVQCAIACALADNAGHERRAVLAAAAVSIGQMLGSLMMGLSEEDRDFVLGWSNEAMTAVVTGEPGENGTPVARVSSTAIVGGNA